MFKPPKYVLKTTLTMNRKEGEPGMIELSLWFEPKRFKIKIFLFRSFLM